MKYLGLWSPGLRNVFGKIRKTVRPPAPRHTYLMYTSLIKTEYLYLLIVIKQRHSFSKL